MESKAILNDVTKCMGCRGCQVACKQWNDLEAEETTFFGGPGYQNPADLSPKTWNLIRFSEWDEEGETSWAFRRRGCMHCTEAVCVDSCPSGALSQTVEGFVVLDAERCVGCRICQYACPYDVPRVNFRTGKMSKCTFCVDRIGNGLEPACVKACATNALRFGSREELLARAQDIVTCRPETTLYGDTQLGGLHVLYILPGELDRFDLPRHPRPGIGFEMVRALLKPLGLFASAALLMGRLEARKREAVVDDDSADESERKEGCKADV